MTWLLTNWRLVGFFAAVILSFFCGCGARGYYQDSVDLAELQGANKAIAAAMERESKISADLEKRLQELKANERVIEREKIKIVDRPVYQSVCLDADGLRIINLSKATTTAKPANTSP